MSYEVVHATPPKPLSRGHPLVKRRSPKKTQAFDPQRKHMRSAFHASLALAWSEWSQCQERTEPVQGDKRFCFCVSVKKSLRGSRLADLRFDSYR
ncbi:hypothetical protein RRG08_001431 [Elysia crispata]|uniref:Uncharacterized protein n=1 Tax=Elysia crispata TaxID=231223 RepID=A0AAE1DKE3_9GAST|nr:hypothetical protein RRG08_001431 [Elysia crispata]